MIYLAKQQKIYGPFSELDYLALKKSGQILNFSWVWDVLQNQWQPIDPAPAPLDLTKAQVLTKPAPVSVEKPKWQGLLAICHNHHDVISGEISQAFESGGELCCKDSSASPKFGTRSQVILNLLNPKSGNSQNVRAHIQSIRKTKDGWLYGFQWRDTPKSL